LHRFIKRNFLDKNSVSREAVPFPIEIASILYEFTIERIFFIAIASSLGACDKWFHYTINPFSSKQTILQPERNLGQWLKLFSPNGGANSNCPKLLAKPGICIRFGFGFL
jgi:hypothetical protein